MMKTHTTRTAYLRSEIQVNGFHRTLNIFKQGNNNKRKNTTNEKLNKRINSMEIRTFAWEILAVACGGLVSLASGFRVTGMDLTSEPGDALDLTVVWRFIDCVLSGVRLSEVERLPSPDAANTSIDLPRLFGAASRSIELVTLRFLSSVLRPLLCGAWIEAEPNCTNPLITSTNK
jgi:hypothetical protein